MEFDELPTRWCERSRPGKAKIISSCFSPGGLFFCTGSADHYVRVYQMDCFDGPQRILEEGEHEDQVDSIQWCNTSQLRLLSGSSDGTARIWTYQGGKWNTIILNMTNDNRSSATSTCRSSDGQDPRQSYLQVMKQISKKIIAILGLRAILTFASSACSRIIPILLISATTRFIGICQSSSRTFRKRT